MKLFIICCDLFCSGAAAAGCSPGSSRWDGGSDDPSLVAPLPTWSLLPVNSTLPRFLILANPSDPSSLPFLTHRFTSDHSTATGFLLLSLHSCIGLPESWPCGCWAFWQLWSFLKMEDASLFCLTGQWLRTSFSKSLGQQWNSKLWVTSARPRGNDTVRAWAVKKIRICHEWIFVALNSFVNGTEFFFSETLKCWCYTCAPYILCDALCFDISFFQHMYGWGWTQLCTTNLCQLSKNEMWYKCEDVVQKLFSSPVCIECTCVFAQCGCIFIRSCG